MSSAVARSDPRAVDPRPDALVATLRAALTCPDALDSGTLDTLAGALRLEPDGGERCALALATFAAVLYARPDLVGDALVDRLADLACAEALTDDVAAVVVRLLDVLATTSLASHAWRRLTGILRDDRASPTTAARLLPLVSAFVRWREDLVELDDILALAESPALDAHRPVLLHAVDRFVFCAPDRFTVERLRRLSALFEDAPHYRYVLSSLAARPTLAPEARAVLVGELAGRFPFHERAAAALKNRAVSVGSPGTELEFAL